MHAHQPIGRRGALAAVAASLAVPALWGGPAGAAEALNFATWSAAVDQVKNHLAAFERKTGVAVAYGNAPFAQYRETMITRFAGGAPVDVLWVSDNWLPEFAEAGWLAPIDGFRELTAYDAEASAFCTQSMIYLGRQYGLTYYTDYMSFLYDADMLAKAGIAAPPATWQEVTEQARTIKAKGLAEYPMAIGLAQESWLIEFMSALVFSHGGRFVDEHGMAAQDDATRAALNWLVEAVGRERIISPGAVQSGELDVLKSFSAGRHAFALLPKYRLRVLNDPAQSQTAGHIRQAMMPMGPGGSHATVGWMRFYGVTPRALATPERAAAAVKLVEWFGGKADGAYRFQKTCAVELGLGFGVMPLFEDAEVRAALGRYGDVDMMARQQSLARKKDTIAPWFGEWNDTNGTAWQRAVLGQQTAAQALAVSAAKWDALKQQG